MKDVPKAIEAVRKIESIRIIAAIARVASDKPYEATYEPANNDLQPGLSWMVAATNCERVGDQLRNGTPVSAAGKTGHFDRRL